MSKIGSNTYFKNFSETSQNPPGLNKSRALISSGKSRLLYTFTSNSEPGDIRDGSVQIVVFYRENLRELSSILTYTTANCPTSVQTTTPISFPVLNYRDKI